MTVVAEGISVKSLLLMKHECTTLNLREKHRAGFGAKSHSKGENPPKIATKKQNKKTQMKVVCTMFFNSSGIFLEKKSEEGKSIFS